MSNELTSESLDSGGITESTQFDKRDGKRLKKKLRSRLLKRNVHPDYIKKINKEIRRKK